MSRWPVAIVLLGLVGFGPSGARAEVGVGLEFGGGGATITGANDGVGQPTLLYGTSLTGPALAFAAGVDWDAPPIVDLGAELGLVHARMQGFAETDAHRRTLDLRFTSLQALIRMRVEAPLPLVRPFAGVGFGGRFGVGATATEERRGFESDEPALEIATHSGWIVAGDLGAVVRTPRLDIPISFRAERSLSYGTTTRDRLVGYRSVSDPGRLLVDANWTYGLRAGVHYRF